MLMSPANKAISRLLRNTANLWSRKTRLSKTKFAIGAGGGEKKKKWIHITRGAHRLCKTYLLYFLFLERADVKSFTGESDGGTSWGGGFRGKYFFFGTKDLKL